MNSVWFGWLLRYLSLQARVPADDKRRQEGLASRPTRPVLVKNLGEPPTFDMVAAQAEEARILRSFTQDLKALSAFRNRAGFAYVEFYFSNRRQPDIEELSLIISGGLNHFSGLLYEWRTGRDATTGIPLIWPPRRDLARALLPLFRHYRCRETDLRHRLFSNRKISLIYFVPPIPPRASLGRSRRSSPEDLDAST